MKFWRQHRHRFFVHAAFLGLRVRLGKDDAEGQIDLARFWAEQEALEHGQRDLGGEAAKVRADLMADPDLPPHARKPQYAHAVSGWVEAETRVQLMREWIEEQDFGKALDADTPDPALARLFAAWRKAATQAANSAATLGIGRRGVRPPLD